MQVKKYCVQITNQCTPVVRMPGIKTYDMALIYINCKTAIGRCKQG